MGQVNGPQYDNGAPFNRDPAVPGVVTQDYTGPSFWWLLPLVALPVLYFLWRGSRSDEEYDGTYQRPVAYAGTKGGRARKRANAKAKSTQPKTEKVEEGEMIDDYSGV